MFSLLSEFTRRIGEAVTVIVMSESELEPPRRYTVRSASVLTSLAGVILGATFLLVSIILFTPINQFLPGHVSAELRQNARVNHLRMDAMKDTLQIQSAYVVQLRNLLMGTVDTTVTMLTRSRQSFSGPYGAFIDLSPDKGTDDLEDRMQLALPFERLTVAGARPIPSQGPGASYLVAIRFPVMSPVSGLTTRSFEARTGHYAIDIAVEEGTLVHSIGGGYVILADWTHDGGQIIAIQHGDGYVSVYKHNSRLLKRAGDRVRAREVVAMSGNSGEITTGPHLHFELWHNGLAQDPSYYVTGL